MKFQIRLALFVVVTLVTVAIEWVHPGFIWEGITKLVTIMRAH